MGKTELKIQIDAAVLEQARAAGLDVSALAEAAVKKALPPEHGDARARRWAEENAEAIKAQQERIDRYGVFGEDMRTW